MSELLQADKKRNLQYLSAVLVMLAIFLGVRSLAEWQNFWNASVAPVGPAISVEGKGELFATPDIAQFTFGVEARAKTVADAQKQSRDIAGKAIDYLKKAGIAERDIKTADYSFYPEYEYQRTICRTGEFCAPEGKQVLTGYRVSQTYSIKVRDTAKTGELVDGLGALAVTNVSGVTFTQEDEDALRVKAREIAIDDAQAKAKVLARDLGVRLVRLIDFSEGNNYSPYYAKVGLESAPSADGGRATELPAGENKIVSNVVLRYEIR